MTSQRMSMTLVAALACGISSYSPPAVAQQKSITIVVPDEPVGLDGCNSDQGNIGRVIKNNVVESLTEISGDGKVLPRLAKSWNQVDEQTWRFELQEGVTFHDGTPFNAAAAVTAINRTMATDTVAAAEAGGKPTGLACRTRSKYFPFKITPTSIDEYTLEIKADIPAPVLATQMSMVSIVSPQTPADKLVREPVGTGPYVFDHWTAGKEIGLKRNEKYWGENGEIETATFVWRNESSVRAAMVELGEADLAPIIAMQDANNKDTDHSYLNSETTWIRIDSEVAPLNDLRVRKALAMSIDRAGLRDALFPADAMPAEQPVVPSIPGHNNALDEAGTPYDPEAAKALIAEARADGAPVDQVIELIARPNDYPNSQEALEAIVSMMQAVGLNVKLSLRESAQWTIALRKPADPNRGPSILAVQHDNNSGDPAISVAHFFSCAGDASRLCDPKIDDLIKNAATTPMGPDRTKKYEELFKVLRDDAAANVYLFHMVGFARVGKTVDFLPNLTTNSEIQLARIKSK